MLVRSLLMDLSSPCFSSRDYLFMLDRGDMDLYGV